MLARRPFLLSLLAAPFTPGIRLVRGGDASKMVAKGQRFLVNLFDPQMNLLPEFEGSKTYWLYHDNYLAAHLLEGIDPPKADLIRKRIASFDVTESGKIEIVFGEAKNPLPFHHHDLVDIASENGKIIRTERLTDKEMKGWEDYADLLALAILAEPRSPQVNARWEKLRAFWDGTGFADKATQVSKIYAVYKLALAVLAARRIGLTFSFERKILERIHATQSSTGGWITDYNAEGKPVGMANVETTCLVLLALGR